MTLYTTANETPTPTPTLAELEAARADIEAKIAAAKQAAMADSVARVLALMDELGVTRRMLGTPWPDGRRPAKEAKPRHTSAGKKVAIKYRRVTVNGTDTWSGRGLQPKWLKEAIAAGASLESFAVA